MRLNKQNGLDNIIVAAEHLMVNSAHTGANDPRVNPMNSRKMTARLQAATGKPDEVLLRTSPASGHGLGTPLSELIEQDVDVYTFLFTKLL